MTNIFTLSLDTAAGPDEMFILAALDLDITVAYPSIDEVILSGTNKDTLADFIMENWGLDADDYAEVYEPFFTVTAR